MPDVTKKAANVRITSVRARFGFVCDVCRISEPASDKAAAVSAKRAHVASAAHRSTLRAARRE
jgi:hypothetical protein